ncbi:hypothetical protein WJX72_009292 [[Myrmecia] bisecta]|uniref:Uncharacterized protein n=1 Tax=[Myrmecia] bisecta TaxID=41462 RepID=A0AAW1R8E9_9CHLO
MIVACDIGGVVTNLATHQPVDGALAGIAELSRSHCVIFVSKCGGLYKAESTAWLAKHGLDAVPTYFCDSNGDKARIASEHGVGVMIDDHIQVLKAFPEEITKVWFCNEPQKVAGTQKYQPELFATLRLATKWSHILDIVQDLHTGLG